MKHLTTHLSNSFSIQKWYIVNCKVNSSKHPYSLTGIDCRISHDPITFILQQENQQGKVATLAVKLLELFYEFEGSVIDLRLKQNSAFLTITSLKCTLIRIVLFIQICSSHNEVFDKYRDIWLLVS